ncbi:glutaredoxin family protein [Herbaspirillum frisingense]|uniref:glutaredoxin family protein n=1 Tax=Herbaspirillum frisingense TaxID=92645 RepID=UPI00028CA144|nr:glutaredoxin family protein [Herbaspirillum frisingense]
MSHTSPASPSEGQPAQPAELQFIIYSRSYCHLCDDLRDALRAALGAQPAHIEMIDVDADPALVARYDELVPVLMGQARDGQWLQLCHYHLDPLRLQDFLAAR